MKKFILAFCFVAVVAVGAEEIIIRDGQAVAFMGDSITQFGWSEPGGYVKLIVAGLQANGVNVTPLPAGVSGNTSREMLARIDKTLARKPDWLLLSSGVNDVWTGPKGDLGVSLDEYKTNVAAIVERARGADAEVVILTATTRSGENPEATFNQKLVAYNDFLRTFADEKKLPLADVGLAAQTAIATGAATGHYLTLDGTHLNPRGNEVVALGVLAALGLNAAQLQTAREKWATIPDAWAPRFAYYGSDKQKSLYLRLPLSRAEYEQLEKVANPKSVPSLLEPHFRQSVKNFLQPDGAYENLDAVFAANAQAEVLAQVEKELRAQVEALIGK